jgi:hypothetical protein
MDKVLPWLLGFAILMIVAPLLLVEIYHRHRRRRDKAMNQRRKPKVKL